jgi:phosphoglycerol transferase MdoB-like AlkP superfamily enzyme
VQSLREAGASEVTPPTVTDALTHHFGRAKIQPSVRPSPAPSTSTSPASATLREELRGSLEYLRPLAIFGIAVLLCLGISRVGLVAWQLERTMDAQMLGSVFLQGLRFDLIVAAFLLVPPVLLLGLFTTGTAIARVGGRLLRWYMMAALGLVLFLELATPSFIAEYDSRPNRLFFEYLIYPREVGRTLLAGYGDQLLAAVAVIVGTIWLLTRVVGHGRRAPARPLRLATALVLTPLLLSVCLVAMRSSFDHRAVNPSMVALSRDPMVNDLALNSTYSVLYAAQELRAEPQGGFRYGSMTDDEALRRVQAGMQIPASAFIPGKIPTLHRPQATAAVARPKNLVIVLEESLGAEFVGALGGLPLTPNLDALSQQGWWFENLYATGTRSVRGLEALTTGFTPTPAQSVIKLGKSQRNFFSIARLLREQGYDTRFIYGGEAQFDNMRRFFMNNGFDSVVDEDDFEDPAFHGSWGVSDEDLLARAHAEFSKPLERPFFSLVFTTSNHSPYEYPDGRIEPYDENPHTVNNAVKYADHALGEFFARARASAYWDDTVFLVVADHNSRVLGAELVPLNRFHIPGLILGGGIGASVYAPIASQIDLPPTLLSLIGVSAAHPMIGHDLTRPEFAAWPGRAIMQYDDTQAYLLGRQVAILRKGLPPATFVYDGELALTPAPADRQLVAAAIAHATWTSSTYERSLYR